MVATKCERLELVNGRCRLVIEVMSKSESLLIFLFVDDVLVASDFSEGYCIRKSLRGDWDLCAGASGRGATFAVSESEAARIVAELGLEVLESRS